MTECLCRLHPTSTFDECLEGTKISERQTITEDAWGVCSEASVETLDPVRDGMTCPEEANQSKKSLVATMRQCDSTRTEYDGVVQRQVGLTSDVTQGIFMREPCFHSRAQDAGYQLVQCASTFCVFPRILIPLTTGHRCSQSECVSSPT